ncbi:hypothetical protein GGE07_001436 [Sinorhizobium terangae]|uniref:ferritin-like domain-containing protein n=1 Tax=Sinorhizobium terangae TaxID=110322 RepID=UPI00180224FB|nr:ferritin-like domain-containing protein [Sinorhizobium terangae]MBB4184810.1 hypothetical protein [Sinorhizobium terangae]
MSEEPKPKYQWRHGQTSRNTFPGATAADISHIRWYHMGWWNWYMTWNWAKNANTWMPPNGQADSARAAALEAKACYDAVLRCEWPIILLTEQSGRLEDYPELRARIAAHVQPKCDHVAMLELCLQQLDASTAKDVPSRDMAVRKRFSAPVSPLGRLAIKKKHRGEMPREASSCRLLCGCVSLCELFRSFELRSQKPDRDSAKSRTFVSLSRGQFGGGGPRVPGCLHE